MPTMPAPGKAYVPHHANQPTSWNQYSEAMLPDAVKLVVESVVILNKPELVTVFGIFL